MPNKNPFMATEVVAQAASPGKPKKLLEQVRDVMGPFVIHTNITEEWQIEQTR
jgi:P2-related tail formation protein